jgi:hypothetical protein
VCDPTFGPERCKSRQRFREGGFFIGSRLGFAVTTLLPGRQFGPLRQAGGGISARTSNLLEEPIDFVGFGTISRSALQ